MILRSSIETSNLRTFSSIRMAQLNLVTWTSLNLPNGVFSTHKLVPHITLGIYFKTSSVLTQISPEVWKDKPYNEKSDIWSMGCVFYEMTTLKPPFHAKDMEGLYNKVIRGYYPKLPSHYSKDLTNIINVCL